MSIYFIFIFDYSITTFEEICITFTILNYKDCPFNTFLTTKLFVKIHHNFYNYIFRLKSDKREEVYSFGKNIPWRLGIMTDVYE